MPSRDLIVFDLDGTLADLTHRLPLLENDPVPWDHFFALAYQDKPLTMACTLFGLLQAQRPNDCALGILTSRPDRWRPPTLTWLEQNKVMPDLLWMRADDDRRTDVEFKSEAIDKLLEAGWAIPLALDDREPIAKLWRSKGIICYHVADGDKF